MKMARFGKNSSLVREINTLRLLGPHPLIIELWDDYDYQGRKVIVMPLFGMDLYDHVMTHVQLPEHQTKKIIKSILEALVFIHSKGILHRDIKLENVLMDASGKIKIIDFNLSCGFNPDNNDTLLYETSGTLSYAAKPLLEAVLNNRPFRAERGWIDVHSVGVVTYALIKGCFPFSSEDVSEMLIQMEHHEYTFLGVSDGAKGFFLFTTNWQTKPSAAEALDHEWLAIEDSPGIKEKAS